MESCIENKSCYIVSELNAGYRKNLYVLNKKIDLWPYRSIEIKLTTSASVVLVSNSIWCSFVVVRFGVK
jgi:hypothetical protein